MKNNRKPSWWFVNIVLIGMLGSLFLAQRVLRSSVALTTSQIGIVLIGYWLVWRWLAKNAVSLEEEETRKQKELEEKLQQKADQAQFEGQNLNPQQIHYLKTLKAKRR